MSGNVFEWVWDWYAASYPAGTVVSPLVDPEGAAPAFYRVARGGSWNYFARSCRSARRGYYAPGDRGYDLGFRLARSK